MKVYFTVWKITALHFAQQTFLHRGTALLFLIGKCVRFGMSLVFLMLLKQNISQFAGYSSDQMVVFYLVYQFIDTVSQVFYRGVYTFGGVVRRGEFDQYLNKPISPLFRALTGTPDINDVLFLIPSTIISVLILLQLNVTITVQSFAVFLIFLINSFLISTALHIFVLTVGVITTEVDGLIWMYRDLIRLGQFPVSIYGEPLRFILYFVVPIGMMVTIPSEVLVGADLSQTLFLAVFVGVGSLIISKLYWNWGLKQYSSASS